MLHHPFALIDWLVLGAYIVVVLLIGFVYRTGREGVEEYFFGRGRMSWWAVGVSLIATSVSASTFLGNPAEAYQFDLRFMQLNVGVPVSIFIVCIVFIPYFRNSGAQSAYELLEKRFDLKTRMLASAFYVVHVLLRTGILIYGPSIIVSEIMGIDVRIVIVIVGLVAVVYTTVGGIRAVIWTDVVQFVVLMGGGLLICFFIDMDVPGGLTTIFERAGAAGKLTWFDSSFDLSNARSIWSAGIAYIVLDLAIRAADQQFVQRYLSCEDVRRSQYAAILSAVLGLFVALLFFMVGVFLWGFYGQYPDELAGITDANRILPNFIATKLPWGVSGLIVAGVFAAAMSSIDSAVNALSNTATIDFYRRFIGKREGEVRFAKRISLLWGFLGIIIGIFAVEVGKNILVLALSFTALFTGALLGIFVLAVAFKRVGGWAVFIGAVSGMVSLAVVTKVLVLSISWPWYPVISMGVTVSVGFLLSFVSNKK